METPQTLKMGRPVQWNVIQTEKGTLNGSLKTSHRVVYDFWPHEIIQTGKATSRMKVGGCAGPGARGRRDGSQRVCF
jgi:hypothetical protein